jgi:hypothetical protein
MKKTRIQQQGLTRPQGYHALGLRHRAFGLRHRTRGLRHRTRGLSQFALRLRHLALGLRHFALWLIEQIVAIVRECNEAQRLAMALRLSPDMYRADADRAPDDYAEFLFRSPMALRREPRAGSTRPPASPTRSL